jgi:alpha-glucosidase
MKYGLQEAAAADEGRAARMRRGIIQGWILLLVVCVGAAPMLGQTLAHKGWAGSGLTIDPWWKGAVFYELDPRMFQDSDGDGSGDLNGITQHLDYLHGLGADALVLSPFQLQAPAKGGPVFDPVYGKEEDFDQLEQQASVRKMRLIVDLPLSARQSTADTLATARFWLSRGVGGLRLVAAPAAHPDDGPAGGDAISPADASERVRQLRRLCAGYVGDRVLLWDVAGETFPPDQAHTISAGRRDVGPGLPQLMVDHAAASLTEWTPSTMKALITGVVAPNAVLVSDAAGDVRSWTRLSAGMDETQRLAVAKMVATVLLTSREAPMLFYGQEIGMASEMPASLPMQWGGQPGFTTGTPSVPMGPNAATATVAAEDANPGSLLNWYRKLSGLRQQGFALKGGTLTLVDTGYPDVVAWVRKGVLISVEQQLKQIGLKPANGMVPLALSFTGINPSFTATGINLPPYGIYLGEILQPGLEDSPAPYVSHRRGR